jgi:epsilon-lactone hydrolase
MSLADHPGFRVSTDGTISVPSFSLPLSAALSLQGAESQTRALTNAAGGLGLANFDLLDSEEDYRTTVNVFRARLDTKFAKPLADKLLAQYPVEIKPGRMGGVAVEEFARAGEHDKDRVLINLHGGAFYSGAHYVARVEAIPVAHIGGVRVVSVDYRQGYEHRFPAATEDVVAVFAELLKSYPADRIGIYGSSAGGILTLQTTASILDRGMPAPGGIGVFSSGGDAAGDGDYFSAIGTAQRPPISVMSLRGSKFGYFANADPGDRLVNPILADRDFRAKFPPCLLITGTRAFDLSPAIATHRALRQAGVEADLHVFDGVGHCFYYHTTTPESLDAYETVACFFRKHLSK